MNDLSMHILDILQNSISAGSLLTYLIIKADTSKDLLTLEIIDNGKGMDEDQVAKLEDPFFTSRTTRRVGMGIPLLKQTATQSGGDVIVHSKLGEGTKVFASFKLTNIDRPPLGDVANAVILTVAANPEIDFVYEHELDGNNYIFDTREIKEVLDGVPLNDTSVMKYLEEMIKENTSDLSIS